MHRRLKVLYEHRKQGISMPLVLCVSAFFIAFAVAILYTAGLLTAQAGERLRQERCYQLAASYAAVLDAELSSASEGTDTFYGFVNTFLDTEGYREYDADRPEETTYFYQPVAGDPDEYGKLRVSLRKERSQDDSGTMSGTLTAAEGNYQNAIVEIQNREIIQYILTVQVRVQEDEESYTYSTEYYRKETYDPIFTHEGKTLVWDNENWHEGTAAGSLYDMNRVTSGNPIRYQLTKDKVRKRIYVNVHEEAEHS